MPTIPKEEIPGFVRRCWNAWRKANITTREAETERLRFYAGGDLQWRDAELQKRKESGRPWVTINKCKPAVDQVEGDIRLNPPGPQCKPVGENADAADPDIIDGLIRECEYRSGAKVAYSTAGKYSAISGYGVLELATEYVNDRDDSQQLVILSVEDPATVFFDPAARMANRQDAKWAGKIKQYSKDEYIAAFGKNRKVLQPGGVQIASGWLKDAFGIGGEDTASLMEWTGARSDGDGRWAGPFYVCEFYMVETEDRKSRRYSDNIWRIDGESVPDGVTPMKGDQYSRTSPNRTVQKYLVDALEAQDSTDWLGNLIPLFPVLGPEIYIEGKLHRLSLISGAMDSNRALNYVATTATEIAGLTTKSPWIGYKGQFDDPRWQSANSEVWAYLEITPTFATNENGEQVLTPPPQRNQWEAPIQWLLALGAFFSDAIKASTSIYDPSLGQNKNDQSGKALEQLRSESNVANFSYADNLHRAIEIMYQEMCIIFPKIYTGPQVLAIVRPDSQHEMISINREFHDGIDPATGKQGKKNTIPLGQYSVRVVVGPNFETRQDEALQMLLDTIKVNPQILGNPTVTAKLIRMIGKGNPQMEGIADIIAPPTDNGDANPQQIQQQLQQSEQKSQQLMRIVQQLHQEIQSKLPQIQADERKNVRDNLTRLAVAEIGASKDSDKSDADLLKHVLGLAHDVGIQAEDHAHESGMADKNAVIASSQAQQQQEADAATAT